MKGFFFVLPIIFLVGFAFLFIAAKEEQKDKRIWIVLTGITLMVGSSLSFYFASGWLLLTSIALALYFQYMEYRLD